MRPPPIRETRARPSRLAESSYVDAAAPHIGPLVIHDRGQAAPPSPDFHAPDVHIWKDRAGVVRAHTYRSRGAYWVHWADVAAYRFTEGMDVEVEAFACTSHDAVIDRYWRSVVPLILQVFGGEVLHASAVQTNAGLVVLSGHSGIGKSTLAYALDQRGHRAWADDAVVFETVQDQVSAIAMPFALRLRSRSIRHFAGRGWSGPAESAPQAGGWDSASAVRRKIRLIVALRRGPDRPGAYVSRLAPGLALQAVLRHANCFSLDDPERKRRTLQSYMSLVASTPVYEMQLSDRLSELDANADAIEALIQDRDWGTKDNG